MHQGQSVCPQLQPQVRQPLHRGICRITPRVEVSVFSKVCPITNKFPWRSSLQSYCCKESSTRPPPICQAAMAPNTQHGHLCSDELHVGCWTTPSPSADPLHRDPSAKDDCKEESLTLLLWHLLCLQTRLRLFSALAGLPPPVASWHRSGKVYTKSAHAPVLPGGFSCLPLALSFATSLLNFSPALLQSQHLAPAVSAEAQAFLSILQKIITTGMTETLAVLICSSCATARH